MELQEFIKQEWGLTDATPQQNIATLLAKQEEIKKINNQIDALKNSFENSVFQEWKTDLKQKYPAFEQVTKEAAGVIIRSCRTHQTSFTQRKQQQCFSILEMDAAPFV